MDYLASSLSTLALNLDGSIPTPTLNVATIRHGLQSLPQELYDKIYLEVFTATPGARYPIYKELGRPYESMSPPEDAWKITKYDKKLLHISRASRKLYAKSYFGPRTEFRFTIWSCEDDPRHEDYMSWLEELSEVHRALLPRVVVVELMAPRIPECGQVQVGKVCEVRKKLLGLMKGREWLTAGQVGNVFLRRGEVVFGRELGLLVVKGSGGVGFVEEE